MPERVSAAEVVSQGAIPVALMQQVEAQMAGTVAHLARKALSELRPNSCAYKAEAIAQAAACVRTALVERVAQSRSTPRIDALMTARTQSMHDAPAPGTAPAEPSAE